MKGFSLKSEEIQELRAAHKEALNRKPVCSAAEYGKIIVLFYQNICTRYGHCPNVMRIIRMENNDPPDLQI